MLLFNKPRGKTSFYSIQYALYIAFTSCGSPAYEYMKYLVNDNNIKKSMKNSYPGAGGVASK